MTDRDRFDAWFLANGFEKYRESMWAAWQAAQLAAPEDMATLHTRLLRMPYPRDLALHLAGATDYDSLKAQGERQEPAMTDRATFERHFTLTLRQQARHVDGSYRDPITQARWEGYQAKEPVYCGCGDAIMPDDGARCGTCVAVKYQPAQGERQPECRCSFVIKSLGDGCQVCNPGFAAEIEAEQDAFCDANCTWRDHHADCPRNLA